MSIVGSCQRLVYPRFLATLFVGALTFAGATGLTATAAQAGATYDATATASVALSFNIDPGANGTVVTEEAELVPDAPDFDTYFSAFFTSDPLSGSFAFGNATASHSGTAATTGIGSSQSATVSGSSERTPNGYSDAAQLTNGFMTIDNSAGTSAIHVIVDIAYSYLLAVTAGDTINEYAEAAAGIIVELFVDDAFIDGLFFSEIAYTDIGVGADSLSGTDFLTLGFTVLAGEIGYVDIFVDAWGVAESIPEPGIALIFGIGLLAAGAARRQTR